MNQQSLMAVLSAYPAPKVSDELLWQELKRAWRNDKAEQHREISGDDATQALMSGRIEKILLTTRLSWATR